MERVTQEFIKRSRWRDVRKGFQRRLRGLNKDWSILVLLMLIAFMSSLGSGVINLTRESGSGIRWLEGWLQNFGTEMVGAVMTFFLIEMVAGSRRRREDKLERWVLQMGSRENGLALQAVKELDAIDALSDGSLNDKNFERANLRGAEMGRVDLRGAKMEFSNFHEAVMYFANFEYADLSGVTATKAILNYANLCYADLTDADLRGAYLKGADLTFANLEKAQFNEKTQLPNRKYWHPEIDMRCFTDPQHPDYWRSNAPESPAYHGNNRVLFG